MDTTNLTEILAYIGAAAWVPQIAYLFYKAFVTPKVIILPDEEVSIGFTRFGPIFNLNLAVSASRRDIIINKINVKISHEDGSEYIFEWKGLTETISEITNLEGDKAIVEKDQPAMALKVATLSLTEKFVRFQEAKFHQGFHEVYNNFEAHFLYLKKSDPDFIEKSLKSKEFEDLMDYHKSRFWWRKGNYKVEFTLESPNRYKQVNQTFEFNLKQYDIDRLYENVEKIKQDYSKVIYTNKEGYEIQSVAWNWRNTKMHQK